MLTGAQIGILFIVLALLFFGLSLRDYLKSAGKKTPARRAWLRVAVIFAIVGFLLYLMNTLKMP
jgi:hypothetical protein